MQTAVTPPTTKKFLLTDFLILIIATIVVYGQVAGYAILTNWDDPNYITDNPLLKPVNLENIGRAFTSTLMGNYAPVQNLSYMFDTFLAGGKIDPAIFHLSSAALHLGSGMVLYWFIIRSTGSRIWALIAAMLFLVHPVQVESVAWLSERKNVLSMFFFLLTLISYQSYRTAIGSKRWIFYGLSFFCTILALFSKASVVVIPVVLALYDLCLLEKEQRPTLKEMLAELLPFAVVAAVMAYQVSILQVKELGGGRVEYHGGSLLATMLTMVHVLALYLKNIVWPSGLSAIYTPEVIASPNAITIGLLIVFSAFAVGGFKLYQRRRSLFFGFGVFFIGLLPVSQIIPLVTLMHDRYLYIPMIGIAWLAGGGVHQVLTRRPVLLKPLATAVVLVIIALTAASYQRTKVWRNSVALWEDTVQKQPGNWGVHDALAEAYLSAGNREGARQAYEKVFSMNPDFMDEDVKEAKALNNAAALFMEKGEMKKSGELLVILAKKHPDYIPGVFNLGLHARLQGDLASAAIAYRHALELEPQNLGAVIALGTVMRDQGNLEEANKLYGKALESGGDGAELRYAMGCLEARYGNTNKALQNLEMAVLKGFNDVRELRTNRELDPVRKERRFQNLLNALESAPRPNQP